MRRAVRVGLVVLGAAMAVYAAASLTGGWLGTALLLAAGITIGVSGFWPRRRPEAT